MITLYVFHNRVQKRAARTLAIRKNPLVRFFYPSSKDGLLVPREVRLISATPTHIVGLEVTKNENKTRYHFKKFCQTKAIGFRMMEFNPNSMP